ncbi:hypothetical protein [Qipengyuania nanhaisediminis]|uniref:hypothetical protein n=1 Tax=Qipengyuania nanhaisediminis TaxID=604088 RepID=UPI0038B26F7B
MVGAAVAAGARLHTQTPVETLTRVNNQAPVTLVTGLGQFEADGCVLATGADPDATQALAGIAIPQRSTPGAQFDAALGRGEGRQFEQLFGVGPIAHSGVTLAPILGRMAVQEILEGVRLDMLAPYRPDRDFEEIRRY